MLQVTSLPDATILALEGTKPADRGEPQGSGFADVLESKRQELAARQSSADAEKEKVSKTAADSADANAAAQAADSSEPTQEGSADAKGSESGTAASGKSAEAAASADAEGLPTGEPAKAIIDLIASGEQAVANPPRADAAEKQAEAVAAAQTGNTPSVQTEAALPKGEAVAAVAKQATPEAAAASSSEAEAAALERLSPSTRNETGVGNGVLAQKSGEAQFQGNPQGQPQGQGQHPEGGNPLLRQGLLKIAMGAGSEANRGVAPAAAAVDVAAAEELADALGAAKPAPTAQAVPMAAPSAQTAVSASNATSTVFTLPTPVHQRGWENHLGERVTWMAKEGLQEAQIQLNPRHLGPVEVRLTLNQDQASVSFTAQNAVTREALEAALPRLREMLNDSGIQLAQAEVSEHSLRQQAQGRGEGGNGRYGFQGGEGAEEASELVELRGESLLERSVIDYYA